MSGVAVASAVVAIGTAVATEGATFAVIAAVGATLGAVGTVAHVRELQIAGAALGAVGLVGGLANAAGMFGEAGAFGSASGSALSDIAQGTTAAETANPLASGASDAWAGFGAAPTTGYEGFGAGAESMGTMNMQPDVISTVTANMAPPDVTPATAAAPDVAPKVSDGLINSARTGDISGGAGDLRPDSQGLPDFQSPTKSFDTWASGGDAPATPSAPTPRDIGATPSDITGKNPPWWETTPDGAPRDQFGNVISQGQEAGGSGDLGAGVRNPAAPGGGDIWNAPAPITADNGPAGFGTGTQGSPMDMTPSGSAVTGANSGAEANVSGFGSTGGPQGPSALAPRAADGSPIAGSDSFAWADIAKFLKDQPILAYGAIQSMGSFLSGATSGLTPAQVDAYKSQSEQNHAAAQLYNVQQAALQRRMTNMNEPMPVASRVNAGLINSASTVTGKV